MPERIIHGRFIRSFRCMGNKAFLRVECMPEKIYYGRWQIFSKKNLIDNKESERVL